MNGATLGGVSRLAGASLVAQLIALLVLPVLTRSFSLAEIGAWTLFAALASNLAIVACGRYEYAIVLPRRGVQAQVLLQLSIMVAAAVAVVTLVVTLGWTALRRDDEASRTLGWWLLWLPLAAGSAGLMQALTLWHNRHARFGVIGRARIAAPAVVAALQLLAATTALGLGGLIAGQVIGGLVGPLWLLGAQRRASGLRWLRLSRRQLLRAAHRYRQFPLLNAPHAFVNALQETLSLSMLAALAGIETAGLFGLMTRVVKAPASFVGGALSEVLLGRLAAQWAAGQDIRPLLRRAALALLAIALPLGGLLLAFGPWLFGQLFGAGWLTAGTYAQWLVPYLVAHFVIGPLTVAPMVIGCQRQALAFSVAGNAIYVSAIAIGAGVVGDMRATCGAISALLVVYFVIYHGWLMRAALTQHQRRQVPAAASA